MSTPFVLQASKIYPETFKPEVNVLFCPVDPDLKKKHDLFSGSHFPLAFPSVRGSSRWFKYDRDDLYVNKSQFVPVIFEPPCIKMATNMEQRFYK
jgi:hypothetical protein